jgi:hypothetical protein
MKAFYHLEALLSALLPEFSQNKYAKFIALLKLFCQEIYIITRTILSKLIKIKAKKRPDSRKRTIYCLSQI